MRTQMRIMCCFTSDLTVTAASNLLNIRRATISEYYDNLRREWLDNLRHEPIQFEDNGEYEVDECLIKHVLDPSTGAHYSLWIGGILERSTGLVKLYTIRDRSRASLLPPILNNIPHGSWIYSDDWVSYRTLGTHPYVHFSVNHSKKEYSRWQSWGVETVNVHINTLEGVNREIRRRFSNKSSRTSERVDLILAEIMYRRSNRSLFYPFKI
jgi:hypothetical protein